MTDSWPAAYIISITENARENGNHDQEGLTHQYPLQPIVVSRNFENIIFVVSMSEPLGRCLGEIFSASSGVVKAQQCHQR